MNIANNNSNSRYACKYEYIRRNNYHEELECIAYRHRCIFQMKRVYNGPSGRYLLCDGPRYCGADIHKGLVQVY